jgi:hypothetical protein
MSSTQAIQWVKSAGRPGKPCKRLDSSCGRFVILNGSMSSRPRWTLIMGERHIPVVTIDSGKRKAQKLASNPAAIV